MKVLVVARFKDNGFAPFVREQVSALQEQGVECRFFPVKSRGVEGYLRHLPALNKVLLEFKPGIVHAHYGLCGLLANLQRRFPVVTTYHGSDINDPKVRCLSKIAIRFSAYNVFVSQNNIDLIRPKKNYALIPCGIDLEDFPLIGKEESRRRMGLAPEGKYVLFAGAFDNPVKNAPLAQAVLNQLPGVQLIELKGYSRSQVSLLMQAAEALLMTSITEGSPQVIKEAMACGCPIVSVDVGDVKERIKGIDGCYVAQTRQVDYLAALLQKAMTIRTNGRDRIIADGLENRQVAQKLIEIFQRLCRMQ